MCVLPVLPGRRSYLFVEVQRFSLRHLPQELAVTAQGLALATGVRVFADVVNHPDGQLKQALEFPADIQRTLRLLSETVRARRKEAGLTEERLAEKPTFSPIASVGLGGELEICVSG